MLLVAAALAFLPPPALTGRVSDTHGVGIAEARVVIAELDRSATTGPDGRYALANLPNGTWVLTVEKAGYAPATRRVTIAGTDAVADLTLTESLFELAPIQVTATPNASAALTSPQPTAIEAGRSLRLNQAASLGRTIEVVPGVRNWSTGEGIGKPVIRGLSSNRVLVLADGQRTETQGWGDEHSPNVETLDADRIEVIKGPASVLYGSDALGGVVNVVPRRLPDAIGERPFVRGTLSLGYATNNRNPDGAAMVEGASGAVGFRAGISGRTSGDIRTPLGPLGNSGNEALGGNAAVGVRGAWGSLQATYTRRDERIEIHEDPAEGPDATPFQRVADQRARLLAAIATGDASRLEATLGWQENDRREFEAAGATEADVAAGLRATSLTADVHWHHAPLGPLVGTVGAQVFGNRFRRYGPENLVPESDGWNAGLFAFEEAEFGRWTLSAGLRYDYRSLDVLAGTVGRETRARFVPAQTRTYHSVTGNLGVLFRLAEPAVLVYNLGRGFRAPSSFDLFAYGVHEGTQEFLIGRPDLGNETSLNHDLAVRVQASDLKLEAGAFYNRISNFIYPLPTDRYDDDPADPEASGLREYEVTQGRATFYGVEAALDWHPTRVLEIQLGTDYTRARNDDLGQPVPWIPPFRVTYTLRLNGADGRWFSAPYLSLGGETNARQDRRDPNELAPGAAVPPGYTLAALGAGVTLPRAGGMTVDLQLRNLFDTQYTRWMSRYREYAVDMGRNLLLRVTLGT